MLKEGDRAPDFRLMGVDGREHTISEFKGKTLVLYFYPQDDTTGCTIQAKDFTAHASEISKLGATVVGISKDDYKSHCDFRDKYGLKVLILSDPDIKTIKKYDAYGNKGVFGMGTIRSTFIIDKSGKILKIWHRVQAIGHIGVVLDYLKNIKE